MLSILFSEHKFASYFVQRIFTFQLRILKKTYLLHTLHTTLKAILQNTSIYNVSTVVIGHTGEKKHNRRQQQLCCINICYAISRVYIS